MRKICISLVLFMLIGNSTAGYGEDLNGQDWLSWEKLERILYLRGYTDGMHRVAQLWKVILEGREIPREFEELSELFDLEGLSLEQFFDGVNHFYLDYRNRHISIHDAFFVVRSELRGVKKERIEEMIRYMRLPPGQRLREEAKELFEKLSKGKKE